MNADIRLKLFVSSVKRVSNNLGEVTSEEIVLNAVYGPEGSPNAQWSKWTPSAQLTMTINNPAAFGKILPGQYRFADLTLTDKDSI